MSIIDYNFEVPTPYSLSQDTPPVNVFELIISNTQVNYLKKREALWARFSNVGIGNPDVNYWVRCMINRDAELYDKYEIRFRTFNEYVTRLNGYTSIDLADSQQDSTSTVTSKRYDPPDVSSAGADATKYLDTQDTTTNVFHQDTHGGLEPDTVAEYMDAVRNPYEEWAREFDKLFYWGM